MTNEEHLDKIKSLTKEYAEIYARKEFIEWLTKEKSLAALGITACGTDERSAYVHRLYHDRLDKKLKELNENHQ